jgi:MFS family permease
LSVIFITSIAFVISHPPRFVYASTGEEIYNFKRICSYLDQDKTTVQIVPYWSTLSAEYVYYCKRNTKLFWLLEYGFGSGFLGVLFFSYLSDRISRVKIMFITCLITGVGLLGLATIKKEDLLPLWFSLILGGSFSF